MATKRHDFIVSAIARKMRCDGYNIIYLDGNFQDIATKKSDIPPRIINHKPDIIGEKGSRFFCVGEAKTRNDLFSERTKRQLVDFYTIVRLNINNKFLIGIPLSSKKDLEKVLSTLGLTNQKQIEILYIPDRLLPYEEEI